jgi:Flp pilus assembly protein TadG
MTTHKRIVTNERGFALAYMAVFTGALLLFSGLAVDTGRAYVVKAQLTKAVDGAALGAARMLNSGDPEN